MKFLYKLFRALNSADSSWQVTLAIALGMIAGLTPLDGLQNLLILFLVFLLNVHLGLFFISMAFFAGVGYLFDPWFEQLGYALLGSETLKGLWTAWYNNGFMRLTHFNNTLVMGATVVSLLIAFPVYMLLGWLIRRYRNVLSVFLEQYPAFGTFGFLKAVDKPHALLRWWGAGMFLLVFAVIAGIALLLVDPLLKWGIEKGGSAALQRDVRVGTVKTDLTGGAISIRRLEIAGNEEGTDAVSADLIRFDADLSALLLDRLHIEKMIVSGVGFDTPATLDKAAAAGRKEADKTQSEAKKAWKLPSFDFPDPKQLIANADLESVKTFDAAQDEIKVIRTRWEKVAKSDLDKEALSGLQSDLDALKKLSRSKDPQSMIELTEKVKAFTSKIEARKKALESIRSDFKKDQKRLTTLMQKVKEAPLNDYNRLKSTYMPGGNGGMNIIGMLFGEKIKTYLQAAHRYYAMISPYLSRDNPPEAAVPPRGEGRWMRYPQTVPSPELLIALTEIDGIFKSQAFAARIHDISDDQKALGRPLTFKATSDGKHVSGLALSGEDNRLGEEVVDRIRVKAKRIPTGAVSLDPVMIDRSNVAVTGDLTLLDASVLKGDGKFAFSDAQLHTEKMSGSMAEIVSGILSDVTTFNVDVSLGGELASPTVGVKSDLDRKLSKGIGRAMGRQLETYRAELKSGLSAQTGDQLKKLKELQGGIADIDGLAATQDASLSDLASQASGMIGGSGSLKKLLPF